jgi:hypothetical protein
VNENSLSGLKEFQEAEATLDKWNKKLRSETAGSSISASPDLRKSLLQRSLASKLKDRSESGSLSTYKTAKSSLGSYVTALSGSQQFKDFQQRFRRTENAPRLPPLPIIVKSPPDHQLLQGADQLYACLKALQNKSDQKAFDTLIELVFKEIVNSTPTGLLLSDLIASKPFARMRKLLACLQQQEHPPRNGSETITSLDGLVEDVVAYIESMDIEPNTFSEATCNVPSFKNRISFWLYMFASGKQHLHHLIPQFWLQYHRPFQTKWMQHLDKRGILQDEWNELEWSGRGQHVEYAPEEENLIPLEARGVLGNGATGVVERVKCRRIMLARKTIRCHRRLTKEEAVIEVEHLHRL